MSANVLRKLSYGVYAVTTWTDGRPTGCIANSAMQITSSPATFAVSINHDNFTNECIKKTKKFALSILAETTDPAIIGTLGFKSGRDINKFDNIGYTVESKLPVLTDSCGYIVCDVIDVMETDTHTVFLGKMAYSAQLGDRKEMTYAYYHNVIKGKSPEKAPTYIKEDGNAAATPEKRFRCTICGYVYEGDALPENYTCPICGVGPELFEEV